MSVRGLIVLVLIIGAGLGWLVRSARIQREAVVAIQSAGGRVYYSWTYKDGQSLDITGPPWPAWLVRHLDANYLGHVTVVEMVGSDGDARTAMRQIGRLDRIVVLILHGSSVTDSDLYHIEHLADLRRLVLTMTEVGDAGLDHLKRLANLAHLELQLTRVTDAGVRRLEAVLPGTTIDH
jgi:hypothetical protein